MYNNFIRSIEMSNELRKFIKIYEKYEYICYLQNVVYICSRDTNNMKLNVKTILDELKKNSYDISMNCDDYNSLFKILDNLKKIIISERDKFITEKVNDKLLEENMKRMFNIN